MLNRFVSSFLSGIAYFYRLCISPLKPNCCRYIPSCSEYAMDAWRIHGSWRGTWLIIKRMMRCHPWGGNGYDPVPEFYSSGKQIKTK